MLQPSVTLVCLKLEGHGKEERWGENARIMDGESTTWRNIVFTTRISWLSPKVAGKRVSGLGNYDCCLGLLAMSPHSRTLAWKIPWMEEPGRLKSMGSRRVGHDWATSLHFSLSCIGEGNGNPLQCSCLENPREGGAWWAAVCGVTQSQTQLKWLSSSRFLSCCSVTSVVSLQPRGLQYTRLPCPSPHPGVCSNSCPLSRYAIQPPHPLLSPSPPAFNLSQHQGLFKWVSSSHQVGKVLKLEHQSFQCIFRVDLL